MNATDLTSQRLSYSLRWAGVVALVASGVVFMLQGLSSLSSFERFLSFAALTVGLAALGLIAGAKMKEAKSARAFLALAAAATPVLFSQLGAMIYSLTETTASSLMPKVLLVTAPSIGLVIAATGVTGLLLTPILYIGFGAYFRRHANEMVGLLLLGSCFLLLPVRADVTAALLVAMQALILTGYAFYARKHRLSIIAMGPAVLLPLTPVAIMVVRGLFYKPDFFFLGAFCLLLTGLCFHIAPLALGQRTCPKAFQRAGLVAGSFTWLFFSQAVISRLGLQSFGLEIMVSYYPPAVAVLLFEARKGRREVFLSNFACALAVVVPILAAIQDWEPLTAVPFLIAGLVVSAVGYSAGELRLFGSGAVVTALGGLMLSSVGIKFISSAPWVSLAILGVCFILLASWLEKNRGKVAKWMSGFGLRFTTDGQTRNLNPAPVESLEAEARHSSC